MDFIRWAINKPVTITVGVILVVLLGLIALERIPIQLTPTVDRPVINVTTAWPGRSPQEIVDSITREQEKRLKNVANLKTMHSTSREGASDISLEFYLGSDINRALQEVSDALRQVPDYPDEVDEPFIKAADGASENAIAWIIIDVDPATAAQHAGYDITTLFDALDKEVKPYIERIDGVAEVNIYGGREREVRVLLDPMAMAQRQLNWLHVMAALRLENRNISAGTIAEGKRDYRVRVVGQFVTEEDVLGTIVAYRSGKPVYLRDIGTCEFGNQKQRGYVRSLGQPCIAMNIIRQTNANVVEVMTGVRQRLDEIRRDILPKLAGDVGPHLRMRQVYDETVYIDSAVRLVLDNIWQGGLLAALVLLVFLRSLTATGVVALVMPISVMGTFLSFAFLGRTLNIISLTGIAFAVGLVVDNAIVVLDNTVRRLDIGDEPRQAAYRGTKEVALAVLASTLTSVVVFAPILTIQEEAGQLFKDISIAITVATVISLVVSITVIPCAAARLIRRGVGVHKEDSRMGRAWEALFGIAPVCAWLTRKLGDGVYWMATSWRAWTVRPAVIALMAFLSLWGSRQLAPPMDYLPTGNRNLVFGGLLIPPGYSIDQQTSIAEHIEKEIGPYAKTRIDDPVGMSKLAPISRMGPPGTKPFDPVPIENFFIGAFNGGMFVGATSQDEERVIPVGQLLTNVMNTVPASFGGARQTSIFGRGPGGGNSVNVEISGPKLERVVTAANMVFGLAAGEYGYANVRPDPTNFNLSQPEWRVRINSRGRELGLTTADVGTAVRGLFDGAFVDDFILSGDTVDLVVLPRGGKLDYKERLSTIPISTPAGPVVPLDSVIEATETIAPQQIQRIEELPSVTVQVNPRPGETVEEVMSFVREKIIAPAEQSGLIDSTMRVRLEGTAAKLDEVSAALFGKAEPDQALSTTQQVIIGGSALIAAGGVVVGLLGVVRAVKRKNAPIARRLYVGALGAVLLGVCVGGVIAGFAWQPQLLSARFVWAVLVTYLIMCSLFEDFVYPLVIMLSVPLAIVGGFAGLRLVHDWTLADPTKAPQQLDVLTMLGFVILVGTVVNNSILLVEQGLALMKPSPFGDRPALEPLRAVSEAIKQRVRPIFMTAATSMGGLLPLVLAPGAGSEMYRGLGAVMLGGLLVSTVFTLVLVPLILGLTVEMSQGLRLVVSRARSRPGVSGMGTVGSPSSNGMGNAVGEHRAPLTPDAPESAGTAPGVR